MTSSRRTLSIIQRPGFLLYVLSWLLLVTAALGLALLFMGNLIARTIRHQFVALEQTTLELRQSEARTATIIDTAIIEHPGVLPPTSPGMIVPGLPPAGVPPMPPAPPEVAPQPRPAPGAFQL